jgi:hypothetical protein
MACTELRRALHNVHKFVYFADLWRQYVQLRLAWHIDRNYKIDIDDLNPGHGVSSATYLIMVLCSPSTILPAKPLPRSTSPYSSRKTIFMAKFGSSGLDLQ